MKCKHPPDHVVTKYDTTGIPEPYELEFRECLDCGEWLSLGPSNDSNVVEIRAAEIATELADQGCEMSLLERCGFNDETLTIRGGGRLLLDTSSTQAGQLARAILEHDLLLAAAESPHDHSPP